MYVALIVLSLACAAVALIRSTRAAPALLALAIGTVWVLRFIEAGHFPLFGTYENALSLAFAIAIAGALLPRASMVTSLVAALVLSQGVLYDAAPYALTISERSLVVDVHAVIAWVAFAVFVVALALAVRVAFFGRDEVRLERVLMLGFVLHTAMIVSGSLYKFMLFGTVWTWDPIETMALITWLAYGTLLHMPLLAGWSSRRLARWSLATFAVLLISYRTIIYFPSFSTYHVFDLALKLHLP